MAPVETAELGGQFADLQAVTDLGMKLPSVYPKVARSKAVSAILHHG